MPIWSLLFPVIILETPASNFLTAQIASPKIAKPIGTAKKINSGETLLTTTLLCSVDELNIDCSCGISKSKPSILVFSAKAAMRKYNKQADQEAYCANGEDQTERIFYDIVKFREKWAAVSAEIGGQVRSGRHGDYG